jgi:ATP-dependent exoDNAse (exonuclease V) beta subunit
MLARDESDRIKAIRMSATEVSQPADASRHRNHTVIMASAGTGKTHQLSNRYLKLLLDGESPDRILATTFTRKAAGEIFDRVIERLVQACFDDQNRDRLATELEVVDLSRAGCLSVLHRISQNLHRVRVDTLDAFFAEVARCFSLEMRLPSDWRIAEEAEDSRIRSLAVNRLLNEKEIRAAEQLVHWITGADSSRRVASALFGEVNLTYEKYVESREQGEAAWKSVVPRPMMSEEELAAALDHLQNLELEGAIVGGIDTAMKYARSRNWGKFLAATIVKNASVGGTFRSKEIPQVVIDAISSVRDYIHDEVVNRVARRTAAAFDLVREFDSLYWDCKRDLGAIRFDDVPRALTGLSTSQGQQQLAYRLNGWIDHLLLDEFQDTSPMQWSVIKELAERIVAAGAEERTFFCVGDVKQAIYGFRGGTSTILTQLANPAGNELPNLNVEPLNVSFRSDQAVIDFVNETFTNLDRHGKLKESMQTRVNEWKATFPRHETVKEAAGYACLESAPDPPLGDDGEPTDKPGPFALKHASRLAAELHQQTPQLEVAVLVDKNDSVAFVIDELLRLGIHASAEGGNPLTDSAAVRIVLSALELAEHPADTAAAFHVAHSGLGVLLDLSPDDCIQRDRKLSNTAERIRRELLTRGYGDTIADWTQALRPACSKREWYRVQQFLDLAYAYSSNLTTRPIEFVHHVESTKKADPTASKVQVMTVHQSKGLGFDRVVLADLAGNDRSPTFCYQRDPVTHKVSKVVRYVSQLDREFLPPAAQAVMREDELRRSEDTLCDLYVSLTRAKHELRVVVSPGEHRLDKMIQSKSGLLRAALIPTGVAPADEVLFERGDRDWYLQEDAPKKSSRSGAQRPKIQLQPATETTLSAPSDHEDPFRRLSLQKAFDHGRSLAMQYGTLIHAWCEAILWLDDDPDLSDEHLIKLAAQADVSLVHYESAIVQFRKYLAAAGIQNVLQRDSYQKLATARHAAFRSIAAATNEMPLFQTEGELSLEVRNEVAVATSGHDGVWGIIDRLILWKIGDEVAAAHILDFKTDVVDGSTAKLRKHYAPQLDAYVAAIRDAFSLSADQVAADLILLTKGELA